MKLEQKKPKTGKHNLNLNKELMRDQEENTEVMKGKVGSFVGDQNPIKELQKQG